ncbi:DUF2480 family protein [Apibacter adventoris]|uniref:DUF2480 domain-containing protein n=1 Tax=Apibacter adventoris TaxID=1679466 RepID=A0A2S8AGN6_9FLAO|nr:DUF2480 family protein [Apibacter adventoris]PQL92533.1 hypothetical protein C4S76_10690 [Apibacter adventoris]PQL95540.1 hypothetical protein C4S77_01735 [Apibacter adventoris]
MEEIENKIAKSGLITLDLGDYYPKESHILFDIKDYLYEGLILKEKDFRKSLSEIDWKSYNNTLVAITCSADAIIPSWAYLLVANHLTGIAKLVVFGSFEDIDKEVYTHIIDNIPIEKYKDKKVIVKGCSHKPVPQNAYIQMVQKLLPVVSSLMFGEACSTVPIYKKKN